MQAVGVLSRTRGTCQGIHGCHLSQQGGGGCSLTDCMQAGPRRTRDHAGWGAGQNRTEETSECLNPPETGTIVIHGHNGQP